MRHELKIQPNFFQAIADGKKTFEIRLDDRGYQEGDEVMLREMDTQYTGREIVAIIGYVTAFKQAGGYVVFSLLNAVLIDGDRWEKVRSPFPSIDLRSV